MDEQPQDRPEDECPPHDWYDPHSYNPIDFIGDLLSIGLHSEGRKMVCTKCKETRPSERGRF